MTSLNAKRDVRMVCFKCLARQNRGVPTTDFLASVRFDERGLIPVVVQDESTRAVLMLAWMNRETLLRTIETRKATYWSRSRQEVWVKGLTSGNTQEVVDLAHDCDGDTILLTVRQTGGACHTGATTCFVGNELGGVRD